MKKALVRWLIEKVFQTEIVEIKVPTVFILKDYLPKDGEWHHISRSIEFWIKDEKVIQDNETTFRDENIIQEVRIWNENTKGKVSKTMAKGTEKNLIAYWSFS